MTEAKAMDACQCKRCTFNPWVRKISWRRKWQPSPIFLSGKSHGQRSLEDYSPWGHKRARHDFETEKQQSLGRDRATAVYALKQHSKQREMGKNSLAFLLLSFHPASKGVWEM